MNIRFNNECAICRHHARKSKWARARIKQIVGGAKRKVKQSLRVGKFDNLTEKVSYRNLC